MALKTVVLFVFTVTVVSGRVIQRPRSHPHQMVLMPALPGSLDHQPYIHPIIENCDEAHAEIIPLPIRKTPLVVPEAPVLAPLEIPKFPASMMVEPCEPVIPALDIPAAHPLPVMPAYPEILPQSEPCLDEVVEIPHQPMVVPQPPELPAFLMPELPAVEVAMPEPCLEDQPIPEYVPPPMPAFVPEMPVLVIPAAPALPPLETPIFPKIVPQPEPCLHEEVIQEISHPILIPQAPELPAFVMPELPVRVEAPLPEPCLEDLPVPEAPVPEYIPLPAPMPMPIAEPCEPDVIMPEIPTAPELPPFAMPALPEVVAFPEPCHDEIVVPEVNYQPMVIPQAPELPAFVMPELPAVEVPPSEPCLEDQPIPVAPVPEYIPLPAPMPIPIEEHCEPTFNKIVTPEVYQPMVIPQAPELPAFVMPELAAKIEPMVAPCPEDIQAPIPEYFQPLPFMPAVPELPKAPSHVPIRVEMPYPITKPEEPCVGEIALVVPQLPKLPETIALPLMPAHPEPVVDPCDHSGKPMTALPPYFVSHPYYMPMNGFLPGKEQFGMRVTPHMRHF